jgi:hypothetical protein
MVLYYHVFFTTIIYVKKSSICGSDTGDDKKGHVSIDNGIHSSWPLASSDSRVAMAVTGSLMGLFILARF